MRRFLKKLALKDKVGQQAPWKLERQLAGVLLLSPLRAAHCTERSSASHSSAQQTEVVLLRQGVRH